GVQTCALPILFRADAGLAVAVAGWAVWDGAAGVTSEVMAISVATGQRRTLLSAPGHDFGDPRISPDGRLAASLRTAHDSYQRPGDVTLAVAAIDGSAEAGPRDLLAGLDRRPLAAAWAPDSA